MSPSTIESVKYDVFLCHNNQDKNIIKEISESLELDAGLLFFLDEYSIPASVEFWGFIEDQLARSATCMICLGKAGWGPTHFREAELALNRRGADASFRVIPVNLPGSDPKNWSEIFPSGYPHLNWVNLTEEPPSEYELEKLRRAVVGDMDPIASAPHTLTPFMIRRHAALWEKSNRSDTSLLYRGKQLDQAMALAAKRPEYVAVNSVPALLEASRRHEANSARRRLVTLALVAMTVSVLALFALFARNAAVEERDIATARSLAVSSSLELLSGATHERAALLARYAYLIDQRRGGRSKAITSSALRALADPDAYALRSSTNGAYITSVSPNGKFYMASRGAAEDVEIYPFLTDGQISVSTASSVKIADGKFYDFVGEDEILVVRADGMVTLRPLDASLHSRKIFESKIDPSGPLVVTGEYAALRLDENNIAILALGDLDRPHGLFPVRGDINTFAIAGNGSLIALGRADGNIDIYRISNPARPLYTAKGLENQRIQSLAFSSNGNLLAVGSQAGLLLWNFETDQKPRLLIETSASVDHLSFSPDDQALTASSGAGVNSLQVCRSDLQWKCSSLPNDSPISYLRFSGTGNAILAGQTDGWLYAWQWPNPFRIDSSVHVNAYQSTKYSPKLHALSASPVNKSFVTGGDHGALLLWSDIASGNPPQVLANSRRKAMSAGWHQSSINIDEESYISSHIMSAAFEQHSSHFYTGDVYGNLLSWSDADGHFAPRILDSTVRSPIWSIDTTDSGDLSLSYMNGQVRHYHPGTQSWQTVTLPQIAREIVHIPGTHALLAGDDSGGLYMIQFDSANVSPLELARIGAISSLALDKQGTELLVGTSSDIQRFRLQAGLWKPVGSVFRSSGRTVDVAWSPSGRLFAAGYDDGKVQIWERSAERTPHVVKAHEFYARRLEFIDDETLVSVGYDGFVRIISLDIESLVQRICRTVWHDLTAEEWRQFASASVPRPTPCRAGRPSSRQ